MNEFGHAIGVYVGSQELYAVHWNGTSWNLPIPIDAGIGMTPSSPKVDMNSSGAAVVVFKQGNDIYGNVFDGTT